MNPEFERIFPHGTETAKLGTGFQFTEGPVWDARGEYLLFSDIPGDRISRWTSQEGLSVFRSPSGKSNGLTLDGRGRLVACEHANRRVSRTEEDGTVVTIASHFQGKKLNSPNDVVVKSDGSVYFTDPPYGLNPMFGTMGRQELPFYGVYRLSPDGSDLKPVIVDSVPNGLAFSPDESLLYVADTEKNHVRVFDVDAAGNTANGRLFADLPGEPLAPDGMKVDTEGNLYVTGKGGVWVFDPKGVRLGIIPVPELPANLCWGESDWKTLFIAARSSVYRVRLAVAGIPVGSPRRLHNETDVP
ncbi:MAG: SMP-30/gluconolactonase/LRE family protein [Desulfomonilaceae bacterium]|nr:SMP-30/gluconolactonase/LRE family protein [Desulfomonilaceae bacterium]